MTGLQGYFTQQTLIVIMASLVISNACTNHDIGIISDQRASQIVSTSEKTNSCSSIEAGLKMQLSYFNEA
jgi:hypothetical protein